MAERFELFRLSLLPRTQGDIFTENLTREEHLRRVFSTENQYTYNGVNFHYVPDPLSRRERVVVGRIGRQQVVEENRPPREGLTETTREAWKAVLIVIDPTEHADGQKAAVAIDRSVAAPGSLLFSLLRSINRTNPAAPYSIEAAPIVETDSFWAFAERNRGEVTTIKFEFVVPNMFGGSDSITEELRAFREEEHARKVAITLTNRDGLNTDTDKTKQAVEYVAKSGGKINARSRTGEPYSSSNKKLTGVLPDDSKQGEGLLGQVLRLSRQILGRE